MEIFGNDHKSSRYCKEPYRIVKAGGYSSYEDGEYLVSWLNALEFDGQELVDPRGIVFCQRAIPMQILASRDGAGLPHARIHSMLYHKCSREVAYQVLRVCKFKGQVCTYTPEQTCASMNLAR